MPPATPNAERTTLTQVVTFYGQRGGIERSVQDLAECLIAEYAVDVLCTQTSSETVEERVNGIEICKAGSIAAIHGRPLSLDFINRLWRKKSDIVHFHAPFPLATMAELLSPAKACVRVATWHHDLKHYPKFRSIYSPFEQKFLRSMDAVIVSSPSMRERLLEMQIEPSRCHVIPFGRPPYETEPDAQTITELQRQYGGVFFLFIGRLVYYKGCEILLQAMSQLNVTLVMVGDGPKLPVLRELAKSLAIEDRVIFAGRVSDTDLTNLFHACHALILPSVSETECFGLVQVEAMLAGKPVINTRLPTGVPWVSIDHETGLTVEPGDPEALAQAMKRLVDDQPLVATLGQQAKDRALRLFTLQKYVDSVRLLYETLLSEKAPTGGSDR